MRVNSPQGNWGHSKSLNQWRGTANSTRAPGRTVFLIAQIGVLVCQKPPLRGTFGEIRNTLTMKPISVATQSLRPGRDFCPGVHGACGGITAQPERLGVGLVMSFSGVATIGGRSMACLEEDPYNFGGN